jgi:hypothetical protein
MKQRLKVYNNRYVLCNPQPEMWTRRVKGSIRKGSEMWASHIV